MRETHVADASKCTKWLSLGALSLAGTLRVWPLASLPGAFASFTAVCFARLERSKRRAHLRHTSAASHRRYHIAVTVLLLVIIIAYRAL